MYQGKHGSAQGPQGCHVGDRNGQAKEATATKAHAEHGLVRRHPTTGKPCSAIENTRPTVERTTPCPKHIHLPAHIIPKHSHHHPQHAPNRPTPHAHHGRCQQRAGCPAGVPLLTWEQTPTTQNHTAGFDTGNRCFASCTGALHCTTNQPVGTAPHCTPTPSVADNRHPTCCQPSRQTGTGLGHVANHKLAC